jgi:hypothetical protein
VLFKTRRHSIDCLTNRTLLTRRSGTVFAGTVAYVCRKNQHTYIQCQSRDDDHDRDNAREFDGGNTSGSPDQLFELGWSRILVHQFSPTFSTVFGM